MTVKTKPILIHNLLNFADLKEITMVSQNISAQEFDAKYYPVKRGKKTSGLFGHSSGGPGQSGRKYCTPSLAPLYGKWKKDRDPSSLYNDPEYFWEGLACSWEVSAPNSGGNIARELLNPHMNKYIHSHPHLNLKFIDSINTFELEWNIFDWGAGVGLTTLLLSQNFPKSVVYYAGTPCSDESKFFKEAIRYLTAAGFDFSNIRIINDESQLPKLDLVVAIEIVEHFTHPMKFLEPILDKLKVNGLFAHSSYWNSEKKMPTLGHFLEYDFDGHKGYLYSKKDVADGKCSPNEIHGSPSISGAWHKAMKDRKWEKLKYDPYGHKPIFWKKNTDTVGLLYNDKDQ